MEGVEKVLLCALFVFCLIDIGHGLSCLSCRSTNITSKCRLGSRLKSPKVETCYGRKSKCYETIKINEYGDAIIQRGCSKLGVCNKEAEADFEEFLCLTCQYNNCNYNYMVLDQEVEAYLLGLYDYNDSQEITEETIVNLQTTKNDAFFEFKNETEYHEGRNENGGEKDKGTGSDKAITTEEYVTSKEADRANFKVENEDVGKV